MRNFIVNEEGQTTVEYLLIIAVIVVVISTVGRKLIPHLIEVLKAGLEW